MTNATDRPSNPVANGASEEFSLAEMVRIMDVATSLRQDRELVEEQLNFDQVKGRLRQKLTEAAKVTGEEVTDAEVEAAIEQYYSGLHSFREPSRDFRIVLAHLWVRRRSILTWSVAGLAVLALITWLFVLPSGPFNPGGRAERRIAALTQSIQQNADRIKAISNDPSVIPELEKLVAQADTYGAQKESGRLVEVNQQMSALEEKLREEYTVAVVATPGSKSAIDRYITDEDGRRVSGYYLIVEARRPDGKVLSRRIHNSETGQDAEVNVWAERVPKEVYDRLARDKREDGILNETVFATKRVGFANEDIRMNGSNGQPLTRMGQITKW
jgi:hypothetical protein